MGRELVGGPGGSGSTYVDSWHIYVDNTITSLYVIILCTTMKYILTSEVDLQIFCDDYYGNRHIIHSLFTIDVFLKSHDVNITPN